MINIVWKGLRDFAKNMDTLAKDRRKRVLKATLKAALLVQKTARQRIMKPPKTGRMYGRHRASAPGESPANNTGNLQRNIEVVGANMNGDNAQATITSKAEYSAYLEFGTERMAPRPFLQPALDENLKKIENIFKDEVHG